MVWMQLLQYGAVLLVAIYALLRGADVFVSGARSLGLSLGVRPFVVGVCIIGLGSSLPEVASSLAAVTSGVEEMVLANVVGSNIANILLIGGLLGLLGGPLIIKTDLMRTELPFLVGATGLFWLTLMDGVVTRTEAVFVLLLCGVYVWYLMSYTAPAHT